MPGPPQRSTFVKRLWRKLRNLPATVAVRESRRVRWAQQPSAGPQHLRRRQTYTLDFILKRTSHTVKKILSLAFFCLLLGGPLRAQEDDYDYKEEISYGLTTNTSSGLIGGIMFKYAKAVSNRQYARFGVELVNVKHERERRSNQNSFQSSFIKDKAFYLFALRPHYGREWVLFRKAPEDGVQLNFFGAVGPSIGITKPYYVRYGSTPSEAVSVPYTSDLIDNNIQGAGGFAEGFDRLRFFPGAHTRAGFSFEFGKFNNSVMGIELGVQAEIYAKQIIIMPRAGGDRFYSAAFFTLYYGNKY